MFSDLFQNDEDLSEEEETEKEAIDYSSFTTKCVAQKKQLKTKAFGDVCYWNNQYSSSSNDYEWYTTESYAPMCSILLQLISPSERKRSQILEIGCGNSLFNRHLIDIGFHHILATDYSTEAIKWQLEKQDQLEGDDAKTYSSIRYQCLNARDMKNTEASLFDIIIDRATLDAIDCEGVDGSVNEDVTVEVAAEVMRVLKNGGIFISLTCRNIERRLESFVNIDQNQYEIVTTKRVEMNKGNTIFIVAIRKKRDTNTEVDNTEVDNTEVDNTEVDNTEVEGEKKTSNTTLKEEEDPKVVEASSSETSPSFCRTKHKSTNPSPLHGTIQLVSILFLLFLTYAQAGRRRPSFTPITFSNQTYPNCSHSLFPLPSHLKCGTTNGVLSPSFLITFAHGTSSAITTALQNSTQRTIQHLHILPYVISRGRSAEPGIEPHPQPEQQTEQQPEQQQQQQTIFTVTTLIITIIEQKIQDKLQNTNESYTLSLTTTSNTTIVTAELHAPNIYGAMYGLSTFTQLFETQSSPSPSVTTITGLPIYIQDQPRFPWRGILLDTANHYFPMTDIYRTLGAMFINRYNVFHLHLVDSYSFPFQSKARPKLIQGAWTTTAIYTPIDLSTLRTYAMSMYGIRVILEIDIPGHAYSWGIGHPEIVAKCPGYGDDIDIGHINAVPMDPSNTITYDVIEDVIREVLHLMGDSAEYIHLGGDEINIGCWNWTNGTETSVVRKWKEKHQYTWLQVIQIFYRTVWNRTMGSKNPPSNVQKIVTWEDLYLNATTGKLDFNSPYVPFTSTEAIVEVWTNTKYLNDVINAGYDGIYAAGWYLDRQQPVDGIVNWEWLDTMWQMYDIDPESDLHVDGKVGKKGTVLGGEASMWSEQVNGLTLDGRMWPRACTIAERLWSSKNTIDHEYAALRLRNHRCRMVELWNIGAGPFWSDHCVSGRTGRTNR